MIRAVRSEAIKLRQPMYGIGAAALVAFMVITMVISVTDPGQLTVNRGPAGLVLSRPELQAPDGLARSIGNGITFLGIVVLCIVAVNAASEYRLGTIRNLLVRQPHRSRLLAAKVTTVLGYVAIAVIVTVAIAAALGQVMASNAGVQTARWWTADGILALGAGTGSLVLAAWGWAAFAILLATVLRSAPAAIGVGVAYALPFEILVGQATPDLARWLPGQLIQALAQGGTTTTAYRTAITGTLAWIAIAIIIAAIVFNRRDVQD